MLLHYHNDNLFCMFMKFLSCKFIRPLKKREKKKTEESDGLPGLVLAFVCELCCILVVLENYVYCEHVVSDQSD